LRRFAPQLFAQLFCIALVLFSVASALAQVPNRPSPREDLHEWALRNARRDPNANQFSREKQLAQIALRNDFRKLQLVNNQLMVRMFAPTATEKMTQKEIRSSLGEIKKVAERLRSNFGFPKVEADEPVANLTLEPGLLQLDKAVMSFVENPLFQQPRVYDTELATRAGRDLCEVFRLAEALKKLAKE
jgi:hypothetical protein